MALETGTYISDLVPANPPGSDPKSQGDDHLRLIKSTIKATFPNITGAVTPTHTELNYVDGVTGPIQDQLDRKPAFNVIINGDMWVTQRGSSFPAITNNTYTVDRWAYGKTGAMVHTVTRDTDTPTVAQAGRMILFSLKADVTTVDSSIAAGDYAYIDQKIEGRTFSHIAQRDFRVSFWVKATKTGTYCVSFRNSGKDRSYVVEYTVDASNTWEYKTFVVPASPVAGTWDYSDGVGLSIGWALASGATFQTTADAWHTGDYIATANQVNSTDNTANNFWLTGVRVTPGEDETEAEFEDYSVTVDKCLRYFYKFSGDRRGYLAGTSNTSRYYAFGFPTVMRAQPTIGSITGTGASLAAIGASTTEITIRSNEADTVVLVNCTGFEADAEL